MPYVEMLEYGTIESDGKTVWVNSFDGCCLGRFSVFGIDVHNTLLQQIEGNHCLDCKKGPCTKEDWYQFKNSMNKFHGIIVKDYGHMPKYLR